MGNGKVVIGLDIGPCMDHGKTTGLHKAGYTKVSRNGKEYGLHRVVYKEFNNVTWEEIKGLVVRHKCDNPRCINPYHLEIGTYKDNTMDMMTRGRHRYKCNAKPLNGESNGRSKLTKEDVEFIRKSKGIITIRALSNKFGISNQQVSKIQTGKSWNKL